MKEEWVKGESMTDSKGKKREGRGQMVLEERAMKQGRGEGGEVFKSVTGTERKGCTQLKYTWGWKKGKKDCGGEEKGAQKFGIKEKKK